MKSLYMTTEEIITEFKKYWPEFRELENIGFKILCFLYTYNWNSCNQSTWSNANHILENILINAFVDIEANQAILCLEALKSFLESNCFSPPGKMNKKSWFGGNIKYVSYSKTFQDFLNVIDNVSSKLKLSEPLCKQILLASQALISGSVNLLNYASNNKLKTLSLFLLMQPSFVSAGWFKKPKFIENIQKAFQNLLNEVNITPVPIPGPYCGPDNFKPIAWTIADKWQFLNKQVSFQDACKGHDSCWDSANSHGDYNHCDDKFYNDLKEECHDKLTGNAREVCNLIATAYYGSVRAITEIRHV